MKKVLFHNFLVILVVFLSILSFTFSVKARSGKKDSTFDRKKLSSTLVLQAKNAIVAGNIKLAESYWQQARAIDPSLPKPNWLVPNEYKENKAELAVIDEKDFVEELKKISYEKAKTELNKRLLINPSNNKLRLAYVELAEINHDETEVKRQREILGLKAVNINQSWQIYVKYVLILALAGLILTEIFIILKTTKREPKLPPHIRSI